MKELLNIVESWAVCSDSSLMGPFNRVSPACTLSIIDTLVSLSRNWVGEFTWITQVFYYKHPQILQNSCGLSGRHKLWRISHHICVIIHYISKCYKFVLHLSHSDRKVYGVTDLHQIRWFESDMNVSNYHKQNQSISSFLGYGCAKRNAPGVYVKVTAVVQWIRNNMKV